MNSIWKNYSDPPKFKSLKSDIKTDVLIIGGGIAGVLTAYFLKEKGVDYTLVEKGRICGGNSGNTTAKITSQHGLIYQKLYKESAEKAKLYLDANNCALKKYYEMCRTIDCDFEVKDNYVYSCDEKRKLEAELESLSKIGYAADFCTDLPLKIKTFGAVRFKSQAQFNPIKFLFSIAKGLNIYENTYVREMVGNTAVTDFGKIKADKVIVATHFPFINKHGSYSLKLYQERSYAIACENAVDVDGMYVDENVKGMSFRNYKDYLIVGGGDHRTGKKGGNWQELRGFVNNNYPLAKERFFWSAQDCMTLDKVPYIGRYSAKTTDLFVATGFNKWGMTGAMVSAMVLTDLIYKRESLYREIFNPSRSMLKPQLLVNGFESVAGLLTFGQKRCPHLGCALKWNAQERSWDCPCHGSRFDPNGKVLDNPANGDMK